MSTSYGVFLKNEKKRKHLVIGKAPDFRAAFRLGTRAKAATKPGQYSQVVIVEI